MIGKFSEDWKNEVWSLSRLRVNGVLEKIVERVEVAENGCFVMMVSGFIFFVCYLFT